MRSVKTIKIQAMAYTTLTKIHKGSFDLFWYQGLNRYSLSWVGYYISSTWNSWYNKLKLLKDKFVINLRSLNLPTSPTMEKTINSKLDTSFRKIVYVLSTNNEVKMYPDFMFHLLLYCIAWVERILDAHELS